MAPRRSILRAMLVAGTLLTALSGISVAQSPAASPGALTSGLDGTNWALYRITAGGISGPPTSALGATLAFVGDGVGGSAGCNQFSAPYTADASQLTVGPILATRSACDDNGTALETSYLTALSTVTGYTAGGATLTLTDATGASVLTFGAAPMPAVEGTWVVTGYSDGTVTVTPTAGSSLTLAFSPDGRTDGQGGCNSFAGPYGVSEEQISIGPLMSTMQTCGDAIDTQEQQYLDALQQAVTWTIASDTLELHDYNGALLVRADRAISH